MKRFSQQLNNKAKELTLSVAEKRDLRDRVVSYMEYHPATLTAVSPEAIFVGSESYRFFNFDVSRVFKFAGTFILLFALSISYLAERAIPGDVLYAVKVDFNEEVRSTLALGSYDKVVWETERLNRRISEARLLADEGRLTEEVEAQVASAVKEHSDNARKEIENLKLIDKDDATLASIELTTALDVQSTSLRNRTEVTTEGQSTNLIEIVLEESQAAELTSEDENLPAYEKLSAKIESETTRAHELLREVAGVATAEEQVDIKRRLDDIDVKILAAIQLQTQDEVASRQGLVEALQQTHRLIVFMTNIDVRASVTVDEIVPVTLTTDEKIETAKKQLEETEAIRLKVVELLTSTSTPAIEPSVLEKITPALEQSSTSAAQAKAILDAAPIDEPALSMLSLEAYNVMTDILSLLGPVQIGTEGEATAPEEVPEDALEVLEGNPEETASSSATSTEVVEETEA